jgi:mRNA interferase HigB
VRVISQSRLKQFWCQPGRAGAEGPLRAWYRHVSSKSEAWRSWADVKAAFANASLVGSCVVFNIGGNKYRLVARVLYPSQKVFILKVLTHAEYDNDRWKDDCGCYTPPPSSSRKRSQPRRSRG